MSFNATQYGIQFTNIPVTEVDDIIVADLSWTTSCADTTIPHLSNGSSGQIPVYLVLTESHSTRLLQNCHSVRTYQVGQARRAEGGKRLLLDVDGRLRESKDWRLQSIFLTGITTTSAFDYFNYDTVDVNGGNTMNLKFADNSRLDVPFHILPSFSAPFGNWAININPARKMILGRGMVELICLPSEYTFRPWSSRHSAIATFYMGVCSHATTGETVCWLRVHQNLGPRLADSFALRWHDCSTDHIDATPSDTGPYQLRPPKTIKWYLEGRNLPTRQVLGTCNLEFTFIRSALVPTILVLSRVAVINARVQVVRATFTSSRERRIHIFTETT